MMASTSGLVARSGFETELVSSASCVGSVTALPGMTDCVVTVFKVATPVGFVPMSLLMVMGSSISSRDTIGLLFSPDLGTLVRLLVFLGAATFASTESVGCNDDSILSSAVGTPIL